MNTKQVDKSHYDFNKYSHISRWVSYFNQLKEIFNLKPNSVLEIGVGDRVIGNYINSNTNIKYVSVDIDGELMPDVVGDIKNLSFEDNSFDVVCAFEVLEHIPFDQFEICLLEMKRVSKKNVLISLPHFGPPVQFYFKIPFIKKISFSFKIPFYKKHVFNGEHYWEIGKKGFSLKKIIDIFSKHFVVERHFVPFESQYHHFFILTDKEI